jgi:hypothetical protein
MAYQYSKDRPLSAKETGEEDPYAVLLAKLTGVSLAKPQKPHAFDLWAAENPNNFNPALDAAKAKQKPTRFQLAGLCTQVKKAEFAKLPEGVIAMWRVAAEKKKHEEALEEWKRRMTSEPSTASEDCQQ